jgi:hypothetical protein
MHNFRTVDTMLSACSPLGPLPREVDTELRVVVLRIAAEHDYRSLPHRVFPDIERGWENVLLYLARRTERIVDSVPPFVATVRALCRAPLSEPVDRAEYPARVFRTARAESQRNQRSLPVAPVGEELRRALHVLPAAASTQDADTVELGWHLRQLISYLDPVDAEIVRLVTWERLSTDVVARILKLSGPGVRARFLAARSILAEQLQASGDLASLA